MNISYYLVFYSIRIKLNVFVINGCCVFVLGTKQVRGGDTPLTGYQSIEGHRGLLVPPSKSCFNLSEKNPNMYMQTCKLHIRSWGGTEPSYCEVTVKTSPLRLKQTFQSDKEMKSMNNNWDIWHDLIVQEAHQ